MMWVKYNLNTHPSIIIFFLCPLRYCHTTGHIFCIHLYEIKLLKKNYVTFLLLNVMTTVVRTPVATFSEQNSYKWFGIL